MTIQSMTGFARGGGEIETANWVWELRSVNGKGLDVRLRLPSGLEVMEQAARKLFQTHLTRGNIQTILTIEQDSSINVPQLNENALDGVWLAAKKAAEKYGLDPPGVGDLLSQRGVLEQGQTEQSDEERDILHAALLASLEDTIVQLAGVRAKEGEALVQVVLGHVTTIEELTRRTEADPSRSSEAIRARLAEQVGLLAEAADTLDPARLNQEAALLAAKADLQEEIDRLYAHVSAARKLLEGSGPVGRKLDFLAQEFNREANTLCSKSNSTAITTIGLELKLAIDQFREQLQNLE